MPAGPVGFELICATFIALLFGAAVCFGGYRFFLLLLPIWGFFFGFSVGAHAVQALLGEAFLGTVTSWVVGFLTALVFAVLAYLFFGVAVALAVGSLGYGLGIGLMDAIGIDFGLISWLVGIVVAAAFIFVTFRFNLIKWFLMLATAVGGAALVVGTLMLGVGGIQLAEAVNQPVRKLLAGNPLFILLFIGLAVVGFLAQYRTSMAMELVAYENRI
jgi:hypothetical protein